MTTITLIQGHPDDASPHLCHALADAYRSGAEDAGHTVRHVNVSEIDFPLIRSQHEFEETEPPTCIREAQVAIENSRHIVLVYPLWLGTMPALLKGFLEQVFRYDFAFEPRADGHYERKLTGRSARLVVTMAMPVLAYRGFFRAHGVKSLERNVLKLSGISPVRETLFGRVDTVDDATRRAWLDRVRALGAEGR